MLVARIALALLAFSPLLPARTFGDDAPPAREVVLADLRLKAVLPPFTDREETTLPNGARAWRGKLHDRDVAITLYTYPVENLGTDEPDKLIHRIIRNESDRSPRNFGAMQLVPGPFGRTPYLGYVVADVLDETEVVAQHWYIAGVAEKHGYVFIVSASGAARPELTAALDAFIRGLRYEGPVRDPKWTEAEAVERWKEIAPDNIRDKLDKVIRTKNYIILTNSAGGNAFAKAMEEYFAAIRKMYPFPEMDGRRLMPVYLFRLDTEYFDFLVKNAGFSPSQARQTKGVASDDWYATWYESPKDSVHIHEATHQIFANRLLLTGGGSWYQEGVAEFMEKFHFKALSEVENVGRAAARRGEGVPLRELFGMASLVFSSERDRKSGGSAAADAYAQAASIIAFVRNDRRTRDKFADFVREMGSVRRADVPAMERVLKRLFDVDIEGFEKMWKDHYK
jgi:hypothetical protein